MQIIMISLRFSPFITRLNGYRTYLSDIRLINERVGQVSISNWVMDAHFPTYGHYVRSWWWLDGKEFLLIVDDADRLGEILRKENEALAYKFLDKRYEHLNLLMDEDDENYFPF